MKLETFDVWVDTSGPGCSNTPMATPNPHGRWCEASRARYFVEKAEKLEAETARLTAELEGMRKELDSLRSWSLSAMSVLHDVADAPAVGPDGRLYYECQSEDGQTGTMDVDPLGWIMNAQFLAIGVLGDDYQKGKQ